MFGPHLPHGKRHADLGIVTFRAAYDVEIGAKQLPQPFFHHRFAIAAGDADYRNVEATAMITGKCLQGLQCVFYLKDIGIRKCFVIKILADHEIAHTGFVQIGYITVPVVAFAGKCKKH